MRASELIGAQVVRPTGEPISVLRDLQVTPPPALHAVGITVGQPGWLDHVAHAWRFAEGRAQGPWPLRKLTRRAAERARFVAAENVREWGPDTVVLGAEQGRGNARRMAALLADHILVASSAARRRR